MHLHLQTALAAAGLLGHTAAASSPAYGPAVYADEIRVLKQLGPRLTGNPSHLSLIGRIEDQLRAIGLQPQADDYTFAYDAPPRRSAALSIVEPDGHLSAVTVAAAYPYSGNTTGGGLRGRLVELSPTNPRWADAAGAIAVVNVTNPLIPPSSFVKTWNASQSGLIPTARHPTVSVSFFPDPAAAVAAGVRGLVLAWDDTITVGNARRQYLPFNLPYKGLPTLYTAGEASRRVRTAAAHGRSASMMLDSSLEPAPAGHTRTVWAVVPGRSRPDETIITLTHTDGVNVVEENGHVGVLQLAQDAVQHPPERTHVFLFAGSHFRTPINDGLRSSGFWLLNHPELWKGGPGQKRCVGGLAIEHLGAVNYADDLATGRYVRTGLLEEELLYANTRTIADLAFQHWVGANVSMTVPLMSTTGTQFGEGEGLSSNGIPNLSLITAPVYLIKEVDRADLVDVAALARQVGSFGRIRQVMDGLPVNKTTGYL